MNYRKLESGRQTLAERLKAEAEIELGGDVVALLVPHVAPDAKLPLVWRFFDEEAFYCEGDIDQIGIDIAFDTTNPPDVKEIYANFMAGFAAGMKKGEWSGRYEAERDMHNAVSLLRKFGIGTVLLPSAAEDA